MDNTATIVKRKIMDCPRCGGQMFLDDDKEEDCIQCGYRHIIVPVLTKRVYVKRKS